MSKAQITRNVNPRFQALEGQLHQEWNEPQPGTIEPVIIEESERQQSPSQLYVIWNEWKGMSQYDRSKIILNVYESLRGRDAALNVTLAMGVTPEEAERMGIEYAPLETAA